ncbi:hypothetical protein ACFLZ0_02345 [Patescibacteria group bacterium]
MDKPRKYHFGKVEKYSIIKLMKQNTFSRKFNVFVIIFILAIGTILGGYFVLESKTSTASISEQISELLEQNTIPTNGCQPNPNNKNQDSDSDGLMDWEEITWKTNPCIADTDKDGYLDGEEVTAGYSPLQPAPGDKLSDRETLPRELPKNLTQALSKNLAQKTIDGQIQPMEDNSDFDILNINYPIISSAIQEVMNQSYEEFMLPKISDEEIIISNNNNQESIELYSQAIIEIMNRCADKTNINREIYETETHLFYEAINNNDFYEINKYINFYEEIYNEIKKIPVPSDFKDIHKEQLGVFWVMTNIYKAIRQIQTDPLKTNLALEQYKIINERTIQIIQKIADRLQE